MPPPQPCYYVDPSKYAQGMFLSIISAEILCVVWGQSSSGILLYIDLRCAIAWGHSEAVPVKISLFLCNQMHQHIRGWRFLILVRCAADHLDCHASNILAPCQRLGRCRFASTLCHREMLIGHNRNKCSIDSDACLHSIHHVGPKYDRFCRLSPVGALLRSIHHMNNLSLGGAFSFQRAFHHQPEAGGLCAE